MSEHRIWRKPDEPQPTAFKLPRDPERAAACIVERLKEILHEWEVALKQRPPFEDLPRTLETLEKAGGSIGAGDAEYFCDEMIAWMQS